jgi:hydrogenase expression/formation protein HypE
MLGMDPLYMANEGKMLIIIPDNSVDKVMEVLKSSEFGKNSRIIGEVVETPAGKVFMKTITGGNRIVDMLVGDQLPRIC